MSAKAINNNLNKTNKHMHSAPPEQQLLQQVTGILINFLSHYFRNPIDPNKILQSKTFKI